MSRQSIEQLAGRLQWGAQCVGTRNSCRFRISSVIRYWTSVDPRDQSGGAVAGEVVPGPLEENEQAVFELHQQHQVHEEPREPRQRSRKMPAENVANSLQTADRRHRPLVVVAERRERLSRQ